MFMLILFISFDCSQKLSGNHLDDKKSSKPNILWSSCEDLNPQHWLLYTGPISLPSGQTTLQARAIRYGYQESEQAIGMFKLNGL
jgi:hypothetical protein